jgi:di/tricarboxylate transporter
MILLEENPDAVLRPQRQWLAILITLVTLGFAATNISPVAEIVLLGAVLLMFTRCMGINDVFQSIEWKAIFLIAGMWPLSIAIQQTGLANVLVSSIIHAFGAISPLLVVTIFLVLAMIFTQLMSGQISAIVLIPLALTAATALHTNPQTLGVAVALGCSLGFPPPLGHPVNIMVMNPGGYTFRDYLSLGLPLTVLAFITILLGIHFVYRL